MAAANLSNGAFTHGSFRSANLKGANLSGSDFDGADFRDADLDRASLHGSNLANARGLTQNQLNDACGDSRTKLPRGLNVRHCTAVRVIVKPGDHVRALRMAPAVVASPPALPMPPSPRYIISVEP